MIEWKWFKSIIGTGGRKYVRRGNQTYLFVSYNDELKEITLKHQRSKRTLIVMPLENFVKYFMFSHMTKEQFLF